MTDPAERTVLVWRREWLAPSETFIANQVAATAQWRPLRAGRTQLPDGLLPADVLIPRDRSAGATAFNDTAAHHHVSLVHAHFGPDGVDVLGLARAAGLPLVVTFHGFDATQHSTLRSPGKWLYRRRLPALFDYASRIVAVSEFIRTKVIALGARPDRTCVLPIGIPTGPALHTYDQHGPITFVGRFVDKKGIPDLLSAVALLPEPHRSRPIQLIGYGPLADSLRQQADRSGLNVQFLGRRTPTEIAQALSTSAVFCAPSQTARNGDAEGFGMVFLEAAQQAVPVVSYFHGGVSEAVVHGQTGLLAPERDVAALSRHLLTVLTDPELARRLGEQGRQRSEQQFSVAHRTRELERLYDQVADEQRTPAGMTR